MRLKEWKKDWVINKSFSTCFNSANKGRSGKVLATKTCSFKSRKSVKQRTEIQVIQQNPLLRHSNRVKLVHWAKQNTKQFQQIIIISADLIIDEDEFWEQDKPLLLAKSNNQSINPSNHSNQVKQFWRQLHANKFVIWVIRRKNSFAKLQDMAQQSNSSLNGVYYIKRKGHYTVDYTPILKHAAQLQQNAQFYILCFLHMNLKNMFQYGSFCQRVPISVHNGAKTIYVRGQQPPGLKAIATVVRQINISLTQSTYELPAIRHFIEQSLEELQSAKQHCGWIKPQIDVDAVLDQSMNLLKARVVNSIMLRAGQNYKFEGDKSVHYFVGDMIKRNRKIFQSTVEGELHFQNHYTKVGVGTQVKREIGQKELRIQYHQYSKRLQF